MTEQKNRAMFAYLGGQGIMLDAGFRQDTFPKITNTEKELEITPLEKFVKKIINKAKDWN